MRGGGRRKACRLNKPPWPGHHSMRQTVLVTLILLLIAACSKTDLPPGEEAFQPLYRDRAVFVSAMAGGRGGPVPQKISGLTVPHHLLAADLIALAFAKVQGRKYRRIVILSPDHYSRSKSPFAVTRRDFETVLGGVATDREAVNLVLKNPLVRESSLFSQEHGVQALLPFIAHYCPGARVVPIAIRRTSHQADWDALAETLAPLLTPETLLVQSTDFSHYLPQPEARRRDQETLRVLSSGDPGQVLTLSEPAHLDSKACQYLQLRLQREVYGAGPTVAANRNSQEYTTETLAKTTSYIVQLYSSERLKAEGVQAYFFGGDTFFGRGVARTLTSPERREVLMRQVQAVTGGNPLIVNLEGVITGTCPESMGPYTLCMPADLALPLLKGLNVRAVSVANNHSLDLGEEAYRDMTRRLGDGGIACLENRQVLDLGAFYLAGFTDVTNQGEEKLARLTREDLAGLAHLKRDKPMLVFLHWGQEFAHQPGPREQALAGLLEEMGAAVIIGCHSHRAGALTGTLKSCRVSSLGNFLFDQDRGDASGTLLEADFFPQGTYFLKVHTMQNFWAAIR